MVDGSLVAGWTILILLIRLVWLLLDLMEDGDEWRIEWEEVA